MLQTFKFPIIPELSPFIKSIWLVDASQQKQPSREKMIPYGCMDIVFLEKHGMNYWDAHYRKNKAERLFITGQITKPYFLEYLPQSKMMGIGFYPHTAHLFTHLPAHEFTDQFIPLSTLFHHSTITSLLDQLDSLEGSKYKANVLQKFIFSQIKRATMNQNKAIYTRETLKQVLLKRNGWTINQASQELNISPRYIQTLFKDFVGVSPHLYAKIVRFLDAMNLLDDPNMSLTEKGYELGYYDQAHFVRDFKRFAGVSPLKYMAEQHQLLDDYISVLPSSFLYNFEDQA